MPTSRAYLAFPLLLLLAACDSAVTPPPAQQPSEKISHGTFIHDLAAEYRDFAENMQEMDEKKAARKMRAKAHQAEAGTLPQPEPADAATQEAFGLLQQQSTEENELVFSQTVALAQIMYDCQTYAAILPPDIAQGCSEEFAAAILELQDAQKADHASYEQQVSFSSPFGKAERGEQGRSQNGCRNAANDRLPSCDGGGPCRAGQEQRGGFRLVATAGAGRGGAVGSLRYCGGETADSLPWQRRAAGGQRFGG